jgi:hypothetical protein
MKRSEMSRNREAMGLFRLHSAYDALICATYSDLGISAGSLNPIPPWPDQVYHGKGLVCVDQGHIRCAELEMMGTAVPVALRRAGICPAA